MLSASILGYSLIHSLGNQASFSTQYETNTKTDFNTVKSIDLSLINSFLPHVPMRRVPKYARMGLIAGIDVLKNAQHNLLEVEKNIISDAYAKKTGLVIGTAYSSSQMNIDYMDSILDFSPELSSPTAFSHAVNNMGAGLLSLYLNIQGGCQTLTQFNFSFAAALQTALLLLTSAKNEYVLLGAIDEVDARFTYTCKNALQTSPFPLTEGAIFFLLGKERIENTPQISLEWHNMEKENVEKTIEAFLSQDKQNQIFLSGEYKEDMVNFACKNNAPFYGTTPLAHALDIYQSLEQNKHYLDKNATQTKSLCICTMKNNSKYVSVQISPK